MIERSLDHDALLAALRDLKPLEFEEFIADLYRNQGHSARLTDYTRDRGRDVIVEPRFRFGTTLVQAKRWNDSNAVGTQEAERYSGLYAEPGRINDVVVVTTGPVWNPARELADKRKLTIIGQDEIVDWVLDKDPQLDVVSSYIDPEEITDEWLPPEGRPSLKGPLMLTIGILAFGIMVGVGILNYETLTSQVAPQSFVQMLPLLFLVGTALTAKGALTAIRELINGELRFLSTLASVVLLGQVSGTIAWLTWWGALVQDTIRGTIHQIPSFTFVIPDSETIIRLAPIHIQIGALLPLIASFLMLVLTLLIRRQLTLRFTIE